RDFDFVLCAVYARDGNELSLPNSPITDTADSQTTQIVAIVDVGDEQLQILFGIELRRRNVVEDRGKERPQVRGFVFKASLGQPRSGIGIDDRKINLILAGIQVDEEIVNFIDHFRDTRIRAIDLVDHHNGSENLLQPI